MRLFICWSGDLSGEVAKYLRRWLVEVVPGIEISASPGIRKGATWFPRLQQLLSDADIGLLCVTQENLGNPWMHFEGGALGMRNNWAGVCPFLIGVEPSELTGPLGEFQAVVFTKEDVRRMIGDLYEIAELPLATMDPLFGRNWSRLYQFVNRRLGLPADQGQQGKGPLGSVERRRLRERALARKALVESFAELGGKIEPGWTHDEKHELYRPLVEAEKDDTAWPLQSGDRVVIQYARAIAANGQEGQITDRYTTPHCYTVKFSEDDKGPDKREFHALYLTRVDFLRGRRRA